MSALLAAYRRPIGNGALYILGLTALVVGGGASDTTPGVVGWAVGAVVGWSVLTVAWDLLCDRWDAAADAGADHPAITSWTPGDARGVPRCRAGLPRR